MKLFIDSADLDEIKEAYAMGIANGVTTNPSLIKKAVDKLKKKGKKVNMESYIKDILRVASGTPVSLEVTEMNYEGMVKQGKALFKKFNKVAKNVYIKIPINPEYEDNLNTAADGIKAIKALTKVGIPINCTLIFTPEQALLAAKAGAKFVSPFAGRIDDDLRKKAKLKFEKTDHYPMEGIEKKGKILEDNGIVSGVDLVSQCVEIFKEHNIKAEVLAASIRNTRQARECALVGAHIATLPLGPIKNLLKHYKTEEGMKGFVKDIIPEYVKLTK